MNYLTKYIACFFLVNYFLLSQVIKPGPETSNWFFGENASIKFDINTKQITADYSPLITEEGCSAVSDNLGNLLFYCSGETVWNRQNQVMIGGDGLYGGYSSTQASLIIQHPGENDLYYVFNTGSLGTDLYYAVVDMKKAGGLGEVVSKNNVIYSGVGEKLTACYAQNRYDIWIITKDKFSHSFQSFLLTSSGINPVPVISPVQLNFDISHKYSAMGYLKFSPDGRHLASASYCNGQFELYDFDNITGLISNTVIIKVDSGLNTYGVAFSPDASLLYVSCFDFDTYLYQYDLSVWDSLAIANSRQMIADFHDGLALGAILEGIDEKLYISHYKRNYLAAIDYPNLKGSSCSFRDSAVYLNGYRTRLGLPNFAYVNSYSDSKPDPAQYDVYIWTESFSASPGDLKSLRVFAQLLNDSIILENAGLSFEIIYEAESFNPDNSSLISLNSVKDRNRILVLNPITFTLDTNPKLIAEIPGVVLFGDKSK